MDDTTIDILKIKIDKAKRSLADNTLNAINSVPWQIIILEMKESRGYNVEQLEDLETETELLLCGLLSIEDYPKQLEKRMNISEIQANDLVNEMNNLVFSKIKDELIKDLEQKKMPSDLPRLDKEGAGGGNSKPEDKPKGQYLKEISKAVYGLNKPNLTIPELKAGIDLPRLDKEGAGGGNSRPPLKSPPSQGEKFSIPPSPSQGEGSGVRSIHPILAQKMSGSFQIPSVKTEHTLDNITKADTLANNDSVKTETPQRDPYREIPE